MSSKDVWGVIGGLGAIAAVMFVVFFLVPKAWGWQVRNWQNFKEPRHGYCQELKKIVKADPIFEDNGKYEDESYRVTYEDGAVGLVDQAQMQSGYYCVGYSWEKDKTAQEKGLVRR